MNDLRVLVSAVLLAAGVAAAVAAGVARHAADRTPAIATVRLAELAAEHAARAVRSDATPEETAAASRAWALALQTALAQVAGAHGAVLLPARAVAAGAPDLTAEVEAAMAAVRPESGR